MRVLTTWILRCGLGVAVASGCTVPRDDSCMIGGGRRCALGEECVEDDAGQGRCHTACDVESPCAAGLECRRDANFTCAEPGPLERGAPCVLDTECGAGLTCGADNFHENWICREQCDAVSAPCAEGLLCSIWCVVPCDPSDPSSCPVDDVCDRGQCWLAALAAMCPAPEPDCPLGMICRTYTNRSPQCIRPSGAP